jgi:hypothetical protein
MKSILTKYLTVLPGTLALSGISAAATITWQSATDIAAGSDVNTDGTQVFGRSLIVATGSPVNGVKFGYAEPWSVTYSEPGGYGQFDPSISTQTVGGPDAVNYKAILGQTRYWGGDQTISFGNLDIGQEYLFQIWACDYRAFPNDRIETITGTGTNLNTPTLKFLDSDLSNTPGASHGQFVIGTWTADSTTMSFTLDANEGAHYSALQLRAIPESGAAVLGSLAVFGLLRRRRN